MHVILKPLLFVSSLHRGRCCDSLVRHSIFLPPLIAVLYHVLLLKAETTCVLLCMCRNPAAVSNMSGSAGNRAFRLAAAVFVLLLTAVQAGAQPDGSTPSQQDIDAFHDWFQAEGGLTNGIALTHIPSSDGLGVVATTSLAEGDHVLQVPLSIVMYVTCATHMTPHLGSA